jgi:hypothetical protein
MRQLRSILMLAWLAALAACSGPAPVVEDRAGDEDAPPPVSAGVAAAPAFECPDSDTRATIVLRGCDTGVANAAIGECTLADHLRACETGPPGDFPRCVAKTTERWVETGVIQGRDKGLIQACAADDRDTDDPGVEDGGDGPR